MSGVSDGWHNGASLPGENPQSPQPVPARPVRTVNEDQAPRGGRSATVGSEGRMTPQMPRLLHMADVHLGARHRDLAEAAAQQRERQFAAFRRAVDAGIEHKVDVVLICGDLFDSNAQPRRTVERAAGELRRLADASIRTVLIPGTHDCYDNSSIYRVFDLAAMCEQPEGSDLITVLTPEQPDVVFKDLEMVVYGRVFDTKRAPKSPLTDFSASAETRGRWRVGMIHGSLSVPGKVEQDEVIFTDAEVARSGLDYLALGHWHSFRKGRSGSTTWAYPGAPEPVALDQDGAGMVVLVNLDGTSGVEPVTIEPIGVGRTRFQKLDLDAATVRSQDELARRLGEMADPDVVLDVRLTGVASDGLEIDLEEVTRQLGEAFLKVRVRDQSVAALPDGPLPPADTIAGAFIRDLEARIADAERAGRAEEATETREILRLGRLLLDDPQRVTLA